MDKTQAIANASSHLRVDAYSGAEPLPICISPREPAFLADFHQEIHSLIEEYLPRVGGILFRGFLSRSINSDNEQKFQQFARSFDHPLLNYEFASTPRSRWCCDLSRVP